MLLIKIPKSFTELKGMIADANIGDALAKVQDQMNAATHSVKTAAPHTTLVEGELAEVIEQIKKLNEQENVLLTRLAELTRAFQKQIIVAKQASMVVESPLTPSEPSLSSKQAEAAPLDATPTTSTSETASEKDATS